MENTLNGIHISPCYYYPFMNFPQYWYHEIPQKIVNFNSSEQASQSHNFHQNSYKINEQKQETHFETTEIAFKQAKQQKKMIKSSKNGIKKQKDYKPYQRKGKKKVVILKDNRNVMPIKIRQMLSFIGRESKSNQIVSKFFQKFNNNEEYSQKRFYIFTKIKKQKVGNYVKLQVLKQFLQPVEDDSILYSIQEQRLYIKLIRVLLNYYLNNIASLCTLNSNRIHSCQKIEHLRIQRQLVDFLKSSELN